MSISNMVFDVSSGQVPTGSPLHQGNFGTKRDHSCADAESVLPLITDPKAKSQTRIMVELEAKLEEAERALKFAHEDQRKMAESLQQERKKAKKAQEEAGIEKSKIEEMRNKIRAAEQETVETAKEVEALKTALLYAEANVDSKTESLESKIKQMEEFMFNTQDELATVSQELTEEKKKRARLEEELIETRAKLNSQVTTAESEIDRVKAEFEGKKEELNKWRFIIEEKKRDCDAMSAFAAAERRNLSEGQAAMGQQKEELEKLKQETESKLAELRHQNSLQEQLTDLQVKADAERTKSERQKLEMRLEIEKLTKELDRQKVTNMMTDNNKLEKQLEKVVGNVIEKDNEEHEVERMQKLENLMLGVLQKEEQRKLDEARKAEEGEQRPSLAPQPPAKKGKGKGPPRPGGKKGKGKK